MGLRLGPSTLGTLRRSPASLPPQSSAVASLPAQTRWIRSSQLRRYPTTGSSSSSSSSSPSSSPSSSSSPTRPKSKYERDRAAEWLIIGASGLLTSFGAYFWYTSSSLPTNPQPSQQSSSPQPSLMQQRPTCTFTSRNPVTGRREEKRILILTDAETDARLTANASIHEVASDQAGGLISRYDVCSVASNNPIEDRSAQAIVAPVARPPSQAASARRGDLAFFAVMDGHSGFQTSDFLSKNLIQSVAREMEDAFQLRGDYAALANAKASLPSKIWNTLLGGGASDTDSDSQLQSSPELLMLAIQKAFVDLDKKICETPLEMLWKHQGLRSAPTDVPSTAWDSILPALSGSCALLTCVDVARRDVFVAVTGDSRAIAGWQNTKDGQWTIEPLSEDQTGRNPSEVTRMKSEHPSREADTVIMRGRVMGGLEPTRAFGDAKYKWSADVQRQLHSAFSQDENGIQMRSMPRHLYTPPYVTAKPVVEWRRLPQPDAQGQKQLRFIVMATDGLWDLLNNDQVGALVAGHLADVKGSVDAGTLQEQFLASAAAASASSLSPSTAAAANSSPHAPTASGSSDSQSPPQPAFSFQDENISTHLIRNALGGADKHRVNALLAIPAPDSRRYRDDITVNVILFGDQRGQVRAAGQEATIKAKL